MIGFLGEVIVINKGGCYFFNECFYFLLFIWLVFIYILIWFEVDFGNEILLEFSFSLGNIIMDLL